LVAVVPLALVLEQVLSRQKVWELGIALLGLPPPSWLVPRQVVHQDRQQRSELRCRHQLAV
jgi:hypothetical protein